MLTSKRETFCQHVASGMGGTEAAKAAGYGKAAAVRASELMRKPPIIERITELRRLVASRIIEKVAEAESEVIERIAIDKAWVLGQLVENVETAKQAKPVTIDGIEVGIYKQNLAAANRALELLGKELGMFVERHEIRTGSIFPDLTDEQLDAAIVAARALVAAQAPGAGPGHASRDQPAQVVPALREAG
jgi:hypothetical protein